MATQTSFLSLVKPLKGEYADTWQVPMNKNADLIDAWAKSVDDEIVAARFNKDTLGDFLSVSFDANGNLLPTPEVAQARNSPVYGDLASSGNAAQLSDHLSFLDFELLNARDATSSLRDALAARQFLGPNMLLDGPADSNGSGQPTFLAYANNQVTVGLGSPAVPLRLLISGYLQRVRTNTPLTVAVPGSGVTPLTNQTISNNIVKTYTGYLQAQLQPGGTTIIDGSAATLTVNGTDSTQSEPKIFTDAAYPDWTSTAVQAGDRLIITSGADAGTYLIAAVGLNGDKSKLVINGRFPNGGESGFQYQIVDYCGTALAVNAVESTSAGYLTLGEVDFSTTTPVGTTNTTVTVTGIRCRNYKQTYMSEWRAIDVVNAAPNPYWAFAHLLGSNQLECVEIHVSQKNDDSAPIQRLSVLDFIETLGVSAGSLGVSAGNLQSNMGTLAAGLGTLAASLGTMAATTSVTPSSGSATAVTTLSGAPSLSGAPALSGAPGITGAPALTGQPALSGTAAPANAVRASWDKNNLYLKPTLTGVFYRDFATGQIYTTGFMRVIVRRKGH